jgi:serine phosphatase RsbU (regulator of sigma subunit)
LCAELQADDSVRCIFSILDPSSGRLIMGLAGHSPPYCSHLAGAQMIEQGTPLGVSLDAHFVQVEATIEPGGCLAFFGEGVFRATNSAGVVLGHAQLNAAMDDLSRSGRRRPDDLMQKLSDYLGPDREQLDDLTIITLEHLQPGGLAA